MKPEEFLKIITLRDEYMVSWANEEPISDKEKADLEELYKTDPTWFPKGKPVFPDNLRPKEEISAELKAHFMKHYFNIPLFYEYHDGAGYCLLLLNRVPAEKIDEIVFHRVFTFQEIFVSGWFVFAPSSCIHFNPYGFNAEEALPLLPVADSLLKDILQGGNSDGISRESAS